MMDLLKERDTDASLRSASERRAIDEERLRAVAELLSSIPLVRPRLLDPTLALPHVPS